MESYELGGASRRSSLTLTILALLAAACGPRTPESNAPAPTRTMVRMFGYQAVEHYTEASRVSTTLPVTPAAAWAVLPEVYEQLDIPIAEVVPSLLELGNPGYRTRRVEGKRMGRYIDCGLTHSGTLANLYDITLSVATRVTKAEGGGAVVTTTLDAWGKQTSTTSNPVHCTSKETLEERIAALVAEKLGSVASPRFLGERRLYW